VVGPAGF